MKYLLDTNVVREIGKSERHKNVCRWIASVDDSTLTISVITVREIIRGVEKLRRAKPDKAGELSVAVDRILDAFVGRILPIDRAVATLWGKALARRDVHSDDVAIAATARVHGLVVVTRNVRHFADRDVAVLDPFRFGLRQRR